MDNDNELARAKQLFIAGIVFLVSCYIAYVELIYLVRGREIEADVTQVQEVVTRGRFRERRSLAVDYRFTEPDGTARTGSDTTATDWQRTPKVAIQYTPGATGRSRFAGSMNVIGLIIFFGSLVWVAFNVYKLHREANEPIRPSRRRR